MDWTGEKKALKDERNGRLFRLDNTSWTVRDEEVHLLNWSWRWLIRIIFTKV